MQLISAWRESSAWGACIIFRSICKVIRIPESKKFFLVESGISGFGIQNPALGFRLLLQSGIQVAEIHSKGLDFPDLSPEGATFTRIALASTAERLASLAKIFFTLFLTKEPRPRLHCNCIYDGPSLRAVVSYKVSSYEGSNQFKVAALFQRYKLEW